MGISETCCSILRQLINLVDQIDEKDFARPVPTLSNATIGQHIRHTVEFFQCLKSGMDDGIVNYDKRKHDKIIESDKHVALHAMTELESFITDIGSDRAITLEFAYGAATEKSMQIQSTCFRELVYNIEHAVHHMALIKIGVREIVPQIQLPFDFGIASSTIRHQESVPEAIG